MSHRSSLLGGIAGLRVPDVAPDDDPYKALKTAISDPSIVVTGKPAQRVIGFNPVFGMGYGKQGL